MSMHLYPAELVLYEERIFKMYLKGFTQCNFNILQFFTFYKCKIDYQCYLTQRIDLKQWKTENEIDCKTRLPAVLICFSYTMCLVLILQQCIFHIIVMHVSFHWWLRARLTNFLLLLLKRQWELKKAKCSGKKAQYLNAIPSWLINALEAYFSYAPFLFVSLSHFFQGTK